MRFALLAFVIPVVASAEPATPVVTKAFIRQIAAGKIKSADLVDDQTGVVEIVYMEGESEPPTTKFARRLCGQKAVDEVAFWTRHMIKEAVRFDEIFTCKNRPRPSCVLGIAGEFMTQIEYEFRPTPDGTLVIDTMIRTNSTFKPKDEARVVSRLRAKHSGGTCD